MFRPAHPWLTATTTSLWFRASPSGVPTHWPVDIGVNILAFPTFELLRPSYDHIFLVGYFSATCHLCTALLLVDVARLITVRVLADCSPLTYSPRSPRLMANSSTSPVYLPVLLVLQVVHNDSLSHASDSKCQGRLGKGRQAVIHHLSGPSAPSTPTPPPPLSSPLLPACSCLPSACASPRATVRPSMARAAADVADALREANVEGALSVRLSARGSGCLQP